MKLNRRNWDVYHLRQDYSHKRQGQSREFLAKGRMAVEQISNFFQQGLMDIDDWWRADYAPGKKEGELPISKEEIKKLVDIYLDKIGFLSKVGDCIKSGLLNSLIILKVHGVMVKKPFYKFEQEVNEKGVKNKLKRGFNDVWELRHTLLMPDEYYPDPSGRGLYEMHELFMDSFDVQALCEGPEAIYDKEVFKKLSLDSDEDYHKKIEKSRQSNQPVPYISRKKIKIQEFWGDVVDNVSGEVIHENVVWTIANDHYILQKPEPNPFWHGKRPFIVTPIIRVPGSVWHTSMMDAPSAHNVALNELYNLILDGGLMATYGIKQYRPDWMEDESEVAEGFMPGQTVAASTNCPPGMKVVERVDTSSISPESLQVFNLTNAEFSASALTNDLRMGVMPSRAVKATEVVEASQSINSVFTGMAKVLEADFIRRVLQMSWEVILQNANDLDSATVRSALGDQRAMDISSMSPEQRFSTMIDGCVFQVFGVSKTISKMNDYKKITAFLQTISASPVLVQEFAQKYSMERLMEEILRSLDINTERLKMDPQEQAMVQQRLQQSMLMQQMMNAGGNLGGGGAGVDQGNIPQAGSENTGPISNDIRAGVPKPKL